MRRALTTISLSLLLVALSATPAAAAIRYVDPGGADTGACDDVAAPCATISYAVGQAVDGVDEIRIAAGTYAEAVETIKRLTFAGAGNGSGAGATRIEPATPGAHAFSLPRGGALRSLSATVRETPSLKAPTPAGELIPGDSLTPPVASTSRSESGCTPSVDGAERIP